MAKDAKSALQKLLSFTRKGVQEYDLIHAGDRVCVGLSGGKDSMALLTVLARLRQFYPKSFDLSAVHVSLGFDGVDTEPMENYCQRLGVPLRIVPSQIAEIVFHIREEKNPCALCANLRRGAVNSAAKELGCNVVALAHHKDDIIETALLSLFYEGRFYCFQPSTYLDRTGLTVIRPFLYVPEYDLKQMADTGAFPVLYNPCPMDKSSQRSQIKATLALLEKQNKMLRQSLFGAIQRDIWGKIGSKN